MNIDCNSCAQGTVAKAIACGSGSELSFSGQQLAVGSCPGSCLDDGSSSSQRPPCKAGEGFLPGAQLAVAPCSSASTQRWQRLPVQ